jgi:electron transfer flavoprotein beta subunit
MLKLAVLLSVGRHPASGRPRRAPLDPRALELALRLTGAEIHAVHAGDPSQAVLRDYLGMGLERLTVLAIPPGSDPVPALITHLAALAPDITLAGSHAEGGEDSGMVPYLVAQSLGHAIVADVAGVSAAEDRASLAQALPRGRRRLIETRLPVVAVVNLAAPEPRQSAFARARRGIIDSVATPAPADAFLQACEIRSWRPRPKRMHVPVAESALDRLKALTETKSGAGTLLIRPAAEDAARAIYDYLLEKRVIEDAGPSRAASRMSDSPPNLSHSGERGE